MKSQNILIIALGVVLVILILNKTCNSSSSGYKRPQGYDLQGLSMDKIPSGAYDYNASDVIYSIKWCRRHCSDKYPGDFDRQVTCTGECSIPPGWLDPKVDSLHSCMNRCHKGNPDYDLQECMEDCR